MTTHHDVSGPGPLLHPMEVTGARWHFVVATLLQAAGSISVLVSAVLALLTVSNNPVTPLLGPCVGLAVVLYVERRFRSDAWAHIPRRRQDLGRQDPRLLAWFVGLLQVACVCAGTEVFIRATDDAARPTAGASLAVGMIVGLLMSTMAAVAWDRVAPPAQRISGAPRGIASVMAALRAAVLIGALWRLTALAQVDLFAAALGLVVVVLASTLGLLFRLVPSRVRCAPEPGTLSFGSR